MLSNFITIQGSVFNLATKRRSLCSIEEHLLPRLNAREVKIERGKDAKLCIIFTSTGASFLSLSLSPPSLFLFRLLYLSRNPTESDREGLSGILKQIQTFFKVIFFNQRLLKDSYLDFVPCLNRSFSLFPPFFLTGDLSIPTRSIFLCLESNKVSDFRWRIQLISLGTRRVYANASRRTFPQIYLKMIYHAANFSEGAGWPRDKKYFKMYVITHGYK